MSNTSINPATKLPHTAAYLARTNPIAGELLAALEHCKVKSKTRKRSVVKLMAERGWRRVSETGSVESQWARA